MQMTGQRLLPVPPQQTWDALNDPEMLKACIPGCESIVETEPNRYEVLMAARIGPVSAKFKGRLVQSDVVPIESYRLDFDGQGGAAGFGKGGATVRLSPADGGTQLDYEANAQVGGKLAQIGSRLVDSAARKIADDFFATFEAKLLERHPAPAAGDADVPDSGSGAAPAPVSGTRVLGDAASIGAVAAAAGGEASGPTGNAIDARTDPNAAQAAASAAAASRAAPGRVEAGGGGTNWLPWAIGAAIAIAIVVVLMR